MDEIMEPIDEEDYSFEDFWHDKRWVSKKKMAYLAWCAMADLFKVEHRLDNILEFMEESFDPDWSTTDMKPVWEVHDALTYALEHAEFDGEFKDEGYNGDGAQIKDALE